MTANVSSFSNAESVSVAGREAEAPGLNGPMPLPMPPIGPLPPLPPLLAPETDAELSGRGMGDCNVPSKVEVRSRNGKDQRFVELSSSEPPDLPSPPSLLLS